MPYLLIVKPWDSAANGGAGAVRPLYFSDAGLTTGGCDDPPHTYFGRRIESPLRVKRSLFSSTSIGGWSSAAWGAVTLANDDGALDWLANLDWDGRDVEIRYAAASSSSYADYAVLFAGTAEQLVLGDEVSIELRDPQVLVDVSASGRGAFAGTGGAEGPTELKGRHKPFLLGRRRKFEPVLIDAASNIYLIDPAGVSAILEVRDQGVPLAADQGDLASFAALKALSLTGTQRASCLAAGMLRLGAKPLGRLTVDADGVKSGGAWISCFADLGRYAITQLGGLAATLLDDASFAAMASLCPHVQGYWYDGAGEPPKVRDIVDKLAADVGAWWGFNESYKLQLGRYEGPSADPAATFTPRDVYDLTPRSVERRLKRQRLGWRPHGVVFTDTDLDNATPVADRILLQNGSRWAEAQDAAVAAASLLAREEEAETAFDAESAAAGECQRRVALYGSRRQAFEVTAPLGVAAGLAVGATIRLIDPRYGLAAGKNFVVLEIERDAVEETIKMTVIG